MAISNPPVDAAAIDAADVDRLLLDALVQTTFAMMGVLTRLAARHDVSLTQLRVLGVLRGRQPKMAELADHLGLERSTVSGLVDRSAQRGFVARVRALDDGRSAHVTLTADGIALAGQAAEDVAADASHLLAALDDADRRTLLGLLQQLGHPPI